MSTGPSPSADHVQCSACGGRRISAIIDLPGLPITGRFTDSPPTNLPSGQDQQLLVCSDCGHGQLAVVTPASDLYDDSYAFRTSESATARGGTEFFFQVLEEVAGRDTFDTVVDIGCNDTYHLDRLSGRARRRIGVDPIWAGHESEAPDGIEVIGSTVEEAQLDRRLDRAPDVVIATHTFEHIPNPFVVLEHLIALADEETLFLVEIPGFDSMVSRYRFDQVFHDHVQYYTVNSYEKLLARVGAEILAVRENYHHLGTLIVAFRRTRRNTSTCSRDRKPLFDAASIEARYRLFRESCETTRTILEDIGSPIYGYGAANILPNLAYHMRTDLSFLDAVFDDDPSKDGLHYWNLRPPIALPERFPDWRDGNVFLTALDNFQPIMRKLLEERPRHLVYPLHVF
jgi:hypothetical protein